jgi:hypothetical protein
LYDLEAAAQKNISDSGINQKSLLPKYDKMPAAKDVMSADFSLKARDFSKIKL